MKEWPEFSAYFRALWNRDPFPWQSMLARRVTAGEWPRGLNLPTASGKTACLDIAVYALAAQADRSLDRRTAPRRIWFVVDRRIVVDEAFERANKLAEKLAAAAEGPLKSVADRLRALSGTGRPLAVARLRGGILREEGWARIPSQPAVITSTVDQLGSRLLFRGYGHSLLSAPIFAGLAANDSLIILDEAHCAVPFMQTLEAVARYRGPQWAEDPIATPFAFVVMSATLPEGIPHEALFPDAEGAGALDHPELQRRLQTSKRAELVMVKGGEGEDDPLVVEAVRRAVAFIRDSRRRVAVMVNRVRTALDVAERIQKTVGGDEADVILLTGRIRPFERDGVVERWSRYLRADKPEEPERPIVMVTTQCLEVGADFSFDALVTECASLDALRQRFGRLARLGSDEPVPAAILIRETETEPDEPDAIYGAALSNTWKWLATLASRDHEGRLIVDVGIEALQRHVDAREEISSLLARSYDAPVLLPAHLDLLCQTTPPPHPEPDVSLYLHGQPGPPEVFVVWRCDLPEDTEAWVETIALCPPVSGEMLQAPLWRVRAWLAQRAATDDDADIEGTGAKSEDREGRIRPCVVWRGRDRSRVVRSGGEIMPGDVVVVPASYGIETVGQATRAKAVGEEGLDIWEAARAAAGQAPAIRLNRDVLQPWLACPAVRDLVVAATDPAFDRDAIQEAIQALLDYRQEAEEAPPPPPQWWLDVVRVARTGRMHEHPSGGVILIARSAKRHDSEPDLFADDDDLASASDEDVSLDTHSLQVRRAAERIADRCLPKNIFGAISLAAFWHDAGKLDPRFQLMLWNGDEVLAATQAPIAKSATVPVSPSRWRMIRETSGLPDNFRHEMLSMELTRRFAELPQGQALMDVVLHLVAGHHGFGRPFAPVCTDPSPPDIRGTLGGINISLDSALRSSCPPSHRLDSGVAERFWRLTRRYGWWGLAYLEAILRLADWYASNFVPSQEDTP